VAEGLFLPNTLGHRSCLAIVAQRAICSSSAHRKREREERGRYRVFVPAVPPVEFGEGRPAVLFCVCGSGARVMFNPRFEELEVRNLVMDKTSASVRPCQMLR